MMERYEMYCDHEWERLKNGTQIHRTALIAPWVSFDDECIVNPYAVVGRIPEYNSALVRVPKAPKVLKIGKNTRIGCHTTIFTCVNIGEDCFIGDYASIREGTSIGDMCVIGRQVTINYNVKIGNRSRFQDGTHITGDCKIGDDCFFGVGVITSNDRKVDLDDYHFPDPPQPPKFGNKILVGSGANILAGCEIGDNCIIGAGALVTKDVVENSLVLGKPAETKLRFKIEDNIVPCDGQLMFDYLTTDLNFTIDSKGNLIHHQV